MGKEPVRIAIVEDDSELRELLRRRMERTEGLKMVRTFVSGDDFLSALTDCDVNVVLMDINMPGTNGIDTVRAAKTMRPEIQFLMLTIFENPAYIFQALCAGATGYLLKNTTSEELEASIHEIHKGGSPMKSAIARLVVNSFQQESRQRTMTNAYRTRKLFSWSSGGMMYKEIAAKAEISTETFVYML